MAKILFFASLKDAIGKSEITIEITDKNNTVAKLKDDISAIDPSWEKPMSSPLLLCAINHEMTTENVTISNSDEIAFFPPVTGG